MSGQAAAQRSPGFQQDQARARHSKETLYRQSLTQLQPMIQVTHAQAISNILLSSAKLGCNPADYAPGMVRTLANTYLQLMHATNRKQRPNAQQAANLVWALGTMHHAAAADDLLDLVCKYFTGLMRGSDAQQRPNSQNVANLLWALAKMKHAPPGKTVHAMLDYFVSLCQIPGLQPASRHISNVFIACADLRLVMRQGQVDMLLKRLLDLHVSQVGEQHYSNVVWRLAVMGLLDIHTFDSTVDKLVLKHNQLLRGHGTKGTSAQPKVEEARQLHQALEWLKPAEGSEQMQAWSRSHSRLQAVAPAPRLMRVSFPEQAGLYNGLATYSLWGVPGRCCTDYT